MTENSSVGEVVAKWYKTALGNDKSAARMARARLRRCVSPADALCVEEIHHLNRLLADSGRHASASQLSLLATTLALVKDIRGKRLASKFGAKPSRDGPRTLGALRFQSLIRIRTHRDLIVPLRRSIRVLGSDVACDGNALAQDLYFWNDKVRNDWCFQYFGMEFAGTNKGEITQ